MNHMVIHYGLTAEQESLLSAALPEEYELTTAECITDLIVANATCTVVDALQINSLAMNNLLAYYLDVGDLLDETVVCLGTAEMPDLPSFVGCSSFLDLLTDLDSILTRARVRYDAMQMYSSEYAYLAKRAIQEQLEEDIYTKLYHKYGTKPNSQILTRLRQEWTAMLERNCVLDVAALYDTVRWLKKSGHPYWIGGFAGSSFVLYLLGITSANPLPPHLYCPKCHHVIWREDCQDGFDIPSSVCEKDKAPMIADGHNVPWQSFWGYSEHQPDFHVFLCGEAKEDVTEWIKGHWLQKFVQKTKDENNLCVLSRIRFGFGFQSQNTATEFYRMQIDTSYRNVVIEYVCNRMIWQNEILKTGICTPTTFANAVSTLGIFDELAGYGNKRLITLIKNGVCASELIAFREDVFFYLQRKGFVEKDAWKGMVRVWEGHGLPVITKEMEVNDDRWILDLCTSNMHRYSKADILELLFFHLKTGKILS